jgi:hypothetical protein
MVKKPEFKLYRICNRENNKAFQGFISYKDPIYTHLGSFFRKPETVRSHLKSLTHEWSLESKPKSGFPYWVRGKEIPNEYKKFYVEEYSVIRQSMETEEASKYLGKSN